MKKSQYQKSKKQSRASPSLDGLVTILIISEIILGPIFGTFIQQQRTKLRLILVPICMGYLLVVPSVEKMSLVWKNSPAGE